MKDYATNRTWSDQFLPEVKRQIGAHLLKVAPDDIDRREATDLMMLDARDTRVAVRIRRPGYHQRYPHQFTIRSKVPSGAQTELSKVVNGHGDWMFYGHASADGQTLDSWQLLDLKAFRAALIRHVQNGYPIVHGDQENWDGSAFKWFDVRSFPSEPPLVVAASG
ncbi:MAG: hypothetical protein AAFN63_01655 [Pseudomonadota bacterium]